ncbi:hypothetical protein ACFL5X_02725 [Candidatus Omnitrophota bacterium]
MMTRQLLLVVILGLCVSFFSLACGPKKEGSSAEAISVAKTMETAQEQTDYLIGQAKAFYSSQQFQDAVETAQYVLRYLDSDSAAAKDLIEKAKEAITQQAQNAIKEATDRLKSSPN